MPFRNGLFDRRRTANGNIDWAAVGRIVDLIQPMLQTRAVELEQTPKYRGVLKVIFEPAAAPISAFPRFRVSVRHQTGKHGNRALNQRTGGLQEPNADELMLIGEFVADVCSAADGFGPSGHASNTGGELFFKIGPTVLPQKQTAVA